ncbi:hypothetical protein TgHK011_004402 [Trichoderma gracile]|nr:hypothetical protein TgHK011_004402 [Trichoderma gracile]
MFSCTRIRHPLDFTLSCWQAPGTPTTARSIFESGPTLGWVSTSEYWKGELKQVGFKNYNCDGNDKDQQPLPLPECSDELHPSELAPVQDHVIFVVLHLVLCVNMLGLSVSQSRWR